MTRTYSLESQECLVARTALEAAYPELIEQSSLTNAQLQPLKRKRQKNNDEKVEFWGK